MTMIIKLGKMVTNNEELPFTKSQDSLISWSCKVTLQIKYIVSLLPQGL